MVADGSPGALDFGDPAFARAVLDAAPVVIVVLDLDGRILHYNPFTERLCGRPLAEVRGRDWFAEFVPEAERDPTRAVFEEALREGPTHGHVNPIRVADGGARLIEWYDRKLIREGEINGIVAVGIDITERVREAAERAELAQRFALFANRVDEAFFMTNATRDRILYLSPAWERILGLPRERVYADPSRIAEVLHPDDLPRFFAALGSAPTEPGGIQEAEYRVLQDDPERPGEPELRWIWIRSSEVRLREDEPPRVVGTITDITERKRAQKQIEELGRTFALFDEAVDEVSFLLSPNRDRVIHASGSVERLFGIDREDVYRDIGVLFERIHPEDRDWLAATIGTAVPREGLSYEYRVLRRDGAVRWMVSRLRVLGPESGMPGAIVSISMDITERHEAEEALRELTEELESRVRERTRSLEAERERLQQILDGMAVHVALLDAEARVVKVNAITARSALSAGFINQPFGAELPGIRLSEHSAELVAAGLADVRAGRAVRFDLEVSTALGCDTVTDTTLSPILDDDGRVTEIVATGVDVTERRATERRLREAVTELERKEARLADAQRIAKVGDWDWDVPSGELSWSAQVYRIFGLDPASAEVSYARFLDCVHPDDREAVIAAVDDALLGSDHYEIEHRIVRPDGEIRQVLENGELTRDSSGAAIRMQGTVHDITEQKQVEAQLRASLREKDALLHEIHHRVKNNLQVVASLLYLQGANAEQSVREVLDECRARIRSMALIHEHLYLSGQLASIDMHEFLAKLGDELLRVFSDDRLISIRVTGGGLQLEIERAVPVALVVTELLTNALKYAYPDAGSQLYPEIRVKVSPTAIEIADDGIGLPEELDQPIASSLGLRLVQALARQLDARLDFERDSGTVVRLLLSESSQS